MTESEKIQIALGEGSLSEIRSLVSEKRLEKVKWEKDETALTYAVWNKRSGVFRYLYEEAIKPKHPDEIKNKYGMTGIVLAALARNEEVVRYLFEKGAKMTAKDARERDVYAILESAGLNALVEELKRKEKQKEDELRERWGDRIDIEFKAAEAVMKKASELPSLSLFSFCKTASLEFLQRKWPATKKEEALTELLLSEEVTEKEQNSPSRDVLPELMDKNFTPQEANNACNVKAVNRFKIVEARPSLEDQTSLKNEPRRETKKTK